MTWLLVTRPTSPLPSLAKLSLCCCPNPPRIPAPSPTHFSHPDEPCCYLVCSAERWSHAGPFLNLVRRGFGGSGATEGGSEQHQFQMDGWMDEQTGRREGEDRRQDSETQQLQEVKGGLWSQGMGKGCREGVGCGGRGAINSMTHSFCGSRFLTAFIKANLIILAPIIRSCAAPSSVTRDRARSKNHTLPQEAAEPVHYEADLIWRDDRRGSRAEILNRKEKVSTKMCFLPQRWMETNGTANISCQSFCECLLGLVENLLATMPWNKVHCYFYAI